MELPANPGHRSTVSFVVPVRNEEEFVGACLQSLVEQRYPTADCEILVVDGRSSDRTREIVETFCQRHPQVCCLENPAGIVPVAMNIGIRAARGDVILRADGHTTYPPDYAANCVKYLNETGADNVGGPCLTVPANQGWGAQMAAAVLSNPYGVGNSRFRTCGEGGFVDTVPFGAFRREIFERLGMYNEKLVRNQDNEFNARIRKAGGKIYLTHALSTNYHPVKTLPGLLKYGFNTSRWHLFTLRESRNSMRLRHWAPGAFLAVLLLLLAAFPVSGPARSSFFGLLGVHLLGGCYWSCRSKYKQRLSVALLEPFACLAFHLAYGAGTFFGLWYLFREPSMEPIRPGLSVKPRMNR
jgi:glycosyltransferase involved in cell wall biosynthesis